MLVTQRKCDVKGTTKGVQSFKLLLLTVPDNLVGTSAMEFEGALPSVPGVGIGLERDLDLCPKALERLILFLNRGASPINQQNTASSEES